MKSFLSKNWDAVVGILMLVGMFYLGRYTAPTKVETQTKTIEVEKVQQHENKIIVEKINKDGSKVIITKVNTDTIKDRTKSDETSKVIESKKSTLNVYAMGGLDVTNPANGFIVGAHVSKQLIGPVSIGLFGFTNKTAGVSIGMSF